MLDGRIFGVERVGGPVLEVQELRLEVQEIPYKCYICREVDNGNVPCTCGPNFDGPNSD